MGALAMAMAAEVAALAARSALRSADGAVGVRGSGRWRFCAIREAVPAFSMAWHAVSTAAAHRPGVLSSTPASASVQAAVAAAMASSAERLLAAAEEAALSVASVGVSREWSARCWVAAVTAGSE